MPSLYYNDSYRWDRYYHNGDAILRELCRSAVAPSSEISGSHVVKPAAVRPYQLLLQELQFLAADVNEWYGNRDNDPRPIVSNVPKTAATTATVAIEISISEGEQNGLLTTDVGQKEKNCLDRPNESYYCAELYSEDPAIADIKDAYPVTRLRSDVSSTDRPAKVGYHDDHHPLCYASGKKANIQSSPYPENKRVLFADLNVLPLGEAVVKRMAMRPVELASKRYGNDDKLVNDRRTCAEE